MAIRRAEGAPVEVLADPIAERLILDGRAMPANGTRTVEPAAEDLPEIDERVDVVGLTDRDPEFFEKQAATATGMTADLPMAPVDRMQRPGRRKGGR